MSVLYIGSAQDYYNKAPSKILRAPLLDRVKRFGVSNPYQYT